jgi:predicted ribonuclease YlaK
MDGGLERKIYVPDTNVWINNPAVLWILSGNADALPFEDFGSLETLISEENRVAGEPNDIVIPEMVIWELESLRKDDEKPATVRQGAALASKLISYLRTLGEGVKFYSSAGIPLPNGASVHGIHHNEASFRQWASHLYDPNRDDRILWAILRLIEANPYHRSRLRFVSEDETFRDKVAEHDLLAESFRFEQVKDPHQRYTGVRRVALSQQEYQDRSRSHRLPIADLDILPGELQPNQIVALASKKNPEQKTFFIHHARLNEELLDSIVNYEWVHEQLQQQPWTQRTHEESHDYFFNKPEDHERLRQDIIASSQVSHRDKRQIRKLDPSFSSPQQMRKWASKLAQPHQGGATDSDGVLYLPFNHALRPEAEQKAAIELLADDSIPVVSIESSHGGGKTLFSILTALLKVNEHIYNGVTYIRPMKTLGEDIGTLPGAKGEKISRFMDPIEDALKEIFGYYDTPTRMLKARILKQINHLRTNEYVTYEVAADIAGRTIRREYVIIDEAHLYTRGQISMLLQRVGKGSKIVFLGDLKQIAAFMNSPGMPKFLNERTSGFAHLPEKLAGRPLYGHITLPPTLVKRSDASALALYL